MLKLISSIFKKKNKMNFAEKTLEELDTELKNSDFQWIKGEQTGMVEKYGGVDEEGNMRFISFKGGGRMNVELLYGSFPSYPCRLWDPSACSS